MTVKVDNSGNKLQYELLARNVDELIIRGYKIHAIKMVRDNYGLGLKEAKDHVENRAAEISRAAAKQVSWEFWQRFSETFPE